MVHFVRVTYTLAETDKETLRYAKWGFLLTRECVTGVVAHDADPSQTISPS